MKEDVGNGYWVKLYVKTISNPIWQHDDTAWKMFELLLMLAYPTGVWSGGRFQLAELSKLADTTLYKALKRLKNAEMVTLVSNNKYTTISICNWEKYQGYSNTKDEQQSNNKVTTNEQQSNTLIRIKNKEKETITKERNTAGIYNENSIVFQIEQKLGITAGDGIYHLIGTSPVDLLALAEKLRKYIISHPDGKWTEPIIKQTLLKWESGARKELKSNSFTQGISYIKPREENNE